MITKIMSKDGGSKVVNLNRRRAVHERCLNCKCWQVGEVSECQERDCQLHPFRTGRGRQSAKDRSRAIREYCRWCTNGHISFCSSPLCPLYPFRKGGVDSAQNARSFPENDDIGMDLEEETERGGNNYAPTAKVLRTERQAGNDQGGGAGRASQEFRQKSS